MATDLTPAEREEKEVERLINKKPAPSRKRTERRGPKHDNRRDRMKVHDPDLSTHDPDLSLSGKVGSRLADIALRIAIADKPFQPPSDVPDGGKAFGKLKAAVADYSKFLRSLAPVVADSFDGYAKQHYLAPFEKFPSSDVEEIEKRTAHVKKLKAETATKLKDFTSQLSKADPGALPDLVAKAWPNGRMDYWPTRASIIAAVSRSMDRIRMPKSFMEPFLKPEKLDREGERSIIKKILDDAENGHVKDSSEKDLLDFANLAGVYKKVRDNPESIDGERLKKESAELSQTIRRQAEELEKVLNLMAKWDKSVSEFEGAGAKRLEHEGYEPGGDLGKAMSSLDSFLRSPKPVVNPDLFVAEYEERLKKRFGEVPADLAEALDRMKSSVAASNDASGRKMAVHKSASYHGVVQQGHPSGPTGTGYRSYDKRYFGKEHFDSILKTAKSLMDEDWLKHGWDGGSDDAKYRAALDLAIHTADSSLYQAKIDAETYDMLLNRLAGWGHDSFNETVFLPTPTGVNRSASAMKTHYQNIVRVANDLRQTDPKRAFAILTNLRALVAQDQSAPSAPAAESAPASGTSLDDLKSKTKKIADSKDMDDFIAGMKDLHDSTKKTAGRVASDMPELAPLEDMSDEEVHAFLDKHKALAKDMDKAPDLDTFMKGFDELLDGAESAAKQVKTSSVRVNLATLVRLAKVNPDVASAFMPVLVAAKKKMTKKKPAKTSQKSEKDEKKDGKDGKDEKKDGGKSKKLPFGGKGAPPFAKKKDEKTSKKRKASIGLDDVEW